MSKAKSEWTGWFGDGTVIPPDRYALPPMVLACAGPAPAPAPGCGIEDLREGVRERAAALPEVEAYRSVLTEVSRVRNERAQAARESEAAARDLAQPSGPPAGMGDRLREADHARVRADARVAECDRLLHHLEQHLVRAQKAAARAVTTVLTEQHAAMTARVRALEADALARVAQAAAGPLADLATAVVASRQLGGCYTTGTGPIVAQLLSQLAAQKQS